jgi:predicted RNA-binding protein
MCEFTVFLDGEKVFEDAVFCRVEAEELLLKDILGQSKRFSKCHIVEVNVVTEKIVLEKD